MNNMISRGVELLQHHWRALMTLGFASIILGSVAIVASFASTLATVFFLGCIVLGGALLHVVESVNTQGWSGFFKHALAAVLYAVAGFYMITHPGASALSLTLIIGVLLAVGGIYEIVSSVALRFNSWGWSFLQGAIAVALSVLIFRQWPVSALWVIGTFVGIDLVFRGIATVMLGLSARSRAFMIRQRVGQIERRLGIQDRRIMVG